MPVREPDHAPEGIEIERKFLVTALPEDLDRHPSSALRQGYVAIEPDGGTEVRVRDSDGSAVLTVKRGSGLTRIEHEFPIAADAFERLWPLTEGRRIEKRRHLVPVADGRVAELDVYGGALHGLLTAEIEFENEAAAAAFEPPAWLGADVTSDERFRNQRLAIDGVPTGAPAGGDA